MRTRLLLLLAPVALVACRDGSNARLEAEWWRLEADRAELAARVEVMQLKTGRLASAREEAEDSTARHHLLSARRQTLTLQIDSTQREIRRMEDEMASLRETWLADRRRNTAGRTLPTLTALNGRVFSQVRITRVTKAGVEFRHQRGAARLVAGDLPMDLRHEFGLDAAQSAIALERESDDQIAYDRWVDRQLDAEPEKDRPRVTLARAPSRKDRFDPDILSKVDVRSDNPLHDPPRRVGGTSSSRRYWYYRSGSSTSSGSSGSRYTRQYSGPTSQDSRFRPPTIDR